tara:strand:- start:1978 stop:2697 length:720 start_codon:yes stop_codon:yes gene_type:complete
MEIGTAFHQHPDDIAHIAVRNLGVPFYMIEMADDPKYRAIVGIENTTTSQWLLPPSEVIAEKGDIPVSLCLDQSFPYSIDINMTHLMWRLVKPTRQQNDFGPTEWVDVEWEMSAFSIPDVDQVSECILLDGSNGSVLYSEIPLPDTSVGKIQYKAMLGTVNGAFPFTYPTLEEGGNYYELAIPYRASFGSGVLSVMMFMVIASFVWGGLGLTLRAMFDDERGVIGLPEDMSEEVERDSQ